MTSRRLWRLLLVLGILTGAASAAHYHVARPPVRPGLGVYDYQYGSRSSSKVAVSRTATLIRSGQAPGPRDRDIKLFQLQRPKELEIEHCAITQVALQLDREGYWTLSLRAYQNAVLPADQAAKAEQAEKAERRAAKKKAAAEGGALFDKRNLFVVKLRAYAMFSDEAGSRDELPGKPVMFTLGPESFWVERGQPYDLYRKYYNAEITRYFDYVDHVELEFYTADHPFPSVQPGSR
jgi:hypothetical protein